MEIKIRNLKKFYDNKKILDIEKLDFSNSKFHTIMGVNGSGKTTLLKIIAGLDKDYQGEIFYNDEIFNKEAYKDITYVGQKSYLFRTSVYENLIYPLKLRAYSEKDIREKSQEYLNIFGLEEIKNQRASSLSSGEAQRLALARAMIFNPKLLILDEAIANINEDFSYQLEKILKEKSKDINVIFVTHNMEQAKRIDENIIFLDNL